MTLIARGVFAERKGLPYQTYMKLLLREGLNREKDQAARVAGRPRRAE